MGKGKNKFGGGGLWRRGKERREGKCPSKKPRKRREGKGQESSGGSRIMNALSLEWSH